MDGAAGVVAERPCPLCYTSGEYRWRRPSNRKRAGNWRSESPVEVQPWFTPANPHPFLRCVESEVVGGEDPSLF